MRSELQTRQEPIMAEEPKPQEPDLPDPDVIKSDSF